VLGDVLRRALVQIGQLLLREPERAIDQPHLNARRAIGRLIEQELAFAAHPSPWRCRASAGIKNKPHAAAESPSD